MTPGREIDASGKYILPGWFECHTHLAILTNQPAEVENDIDKLSARIEPILTVAIAGIVLVLALGVFLPMWNLAEVAIK